MELKETRNLSAGVKALLVPLFAIMCGFMWRVRGSHGWGSMWGMFAVGVMMILVIYAFFGNRRKMSYEAIPAAVILLGITNGGWGTLNSQMGGYLGSTAPFTGEEVAATVEINPYYGLWVMLLLGFGWMPLFSIFIGSLFSKRDYKIKNYIAIVAVFYALVAVFMFVVSHFILPYISPTAVDMFKDGLADKGIEMSPLMAFIKNLGSEAWFKKIPFGRNYYASIRVISYSAAALLTSLTVLVAFRDKITAFISTAINAIMALSITLADVFLIIDSDKGFLAGITPPAFLAQGSWSLWEYFTGFLMGFGVMLLLVCLPKKITQGEGRFEYTEPFGKKWIFAAYSAVLTLFFTFVLTIARPAGMRIAEMLAARGIIGETDVVEIVIMAVIGVIGFAACIPVVKKNVVAKALPVPVPKRAEDFCMSAAPLYFLVTALMYFFTDEACLVQLIKNPSSLLNVTRDSGVVLVLLMLASFILFYVLYLAASKKSKKI
ncbi:MAG: hypothetical protein IJF57_01555 [Clostridia bacterium]|nr:hypothetical protein [Clostridia bacterium]